MVAVRVSEVYDLSTQVNKVGMVAIHTPALTAAKKLWKGLFDQYTFMRLAKCDVTLVCAQTLPADPLQVGTESGEIAPQDMFNPILYKAVSNESFNRVLNRMYGLSAVNTLGSVDEGDLSTDANIDQFKLYYGLLADDDGWKKAMPQSGLSMRGLYPIVYSVVHPFGNMNSDNDTLADNLGKVPAVAGDGSLGASDRVYPNPFRGPSMRMPRVPTKAVLHIDGTQNYSVQDSAFPRTYVACMVMPPAKLHKLYYRMRVTWTIEFEGLRPLTDVGTMSDIASLGQNTYATDYVEQSKMMEAKTDAVDGNGVAIEKIMTAGK